MTFSLYPGGKATPTGTTGIGLFAALSLMVVPGRPASPTKLLLAAVALDEPLLTKNLMTVGAFVPAGMILIWSKNPPFVASAVQTVTTVPVPSLAVLEPVITPHWISPRREKIGEVAAGKGNTSL